MDESKRQEIQRRQETLLRELERLTSRFGRRSDDPHAAELEYYLTRLSSAVIGFHASGFHFSDYSHRERPELPAQLDALLSRIGEIRDLAEHARGVLLRPPPEEGKSGFTE
jgi:hypothetical protein